MKDAVQRLVVLWEDSHRREEPKLEYDRGTKTTQGPILDLVRSVLGPVFSNRGMPQPDFEREVRDILYG